MPTQKHILITGAAGGIGSAIKKTLEKEGNRVTSVRRDEADLSSYANIAKFEQKISSDRLQFDWLVLAHGFIDSETDFEHQAPENIKRTFAINTLAGIYFAQLFLKHVSAGGGIIFIASTAGLHGNDIYPVYAASKAAINTFAKALARRYKGRRFYSVCPGPTDTAMWQKIGGAHDDAQDPADVAKAVTEIISGAYTSGDVIVVRDGHISLATTDT